MPDTNDHHFTAEDTAHLSEQASRCRRLARFTHDRSTARILEQLAEDYEQKAQRGGDAAG